MHTVYRIFLNPIEGRENYLNKKAKEGYELVSSGGLVHKFRKSNQDKSYMVQYIGYMNNQERQEYQHFLEDMNMIVLYAPLNLGKRSLGNVKLRLFNSPKAMVSTSCGMINREIMIIENTTPYHLELYSDDTSKSRDLARRKKPYFYLLILSVLMIAISALNKSGVDTQLFNETLMSLRPGDTFILPWVILGGVMGIYSIAGLIQLNHLAHKIESKRI